MTVDDTQRLDWMEQHQATLEVFSKETLRWGVYPRFSFVGRGMTLREAIDAAMDRESKEKPCTTRAD